ncbi:MAG: pyrophosphatase [Elusimicrobiota bacterium]
MNWLKQFSEQAAGSDQFRGREDQRLLLATGLFGEAGSVLSELKKMEREGSAYPHYRQRLAEELGDCIWYFIRLASEFDPKLLDELPLESQITEGGVSQLRLSAQLGAAVGNVLACLGASRTLELRKELIAVWGGLADVAKQAGMTLEQAARANQSKTGSRWPAKREFHPLFDDGFPSEDQLPRVLTIEFLERQRGSRAEIVLRCQGLNIGDRLTDNIANEDGYRYHDIFHFAYAVFLGWSPVTRALLRCKRKSRPEVDENQDGARALILEEAVSAVVFGRAKQMKYFEGASHVDYDLLKSVREFVRGYEIEQIPMWQWEVAILEGARLFRLLRDGRGGVISWNIATHRMDYTSPANPPRAGQA